MSKIAVEGEAMIDNVQRATVATATPAPTVELSCYRVSMLSGSLEVTARLKDADDLDLLMRVLEANKSLFANASATEVLVRPDRSENRFRKEDRSQVELLAERHPPETEVLGKPDRKATKTAAKVHRLESKQSVKANPSETDILTLT